ncbi:hypothetical protein QQS21_010964 [Conoideocrella luteorostrata]|uniref:Peptidase M43 pregnancy-associated plasma-A domain-containing protein n=1 Tax=Conoideocrella luteorostrata TaxID=1105319 RepID=A0AAJ0CEA1_9HYPO|nr:hypothetical protein QQS21_010964 [Conoideocrella luteorostrata]
MALKNILLIAASMAAAVMGAAVNNGECGAPEPTEEHIAVAKLMAVNETMINANEFAAQANVNVPVYVHVVAKSKNEYAKDKDIRSTIADMNADYRNMGFQFSLKSIDYTVNKDWASGKNDMAMKKKLRKGNYKTLNLYYVNTVRSSTSGQINGQCYFPTSGAKGDVLTRDGCTIRQDQMTNGQTTTHEVGHWLGLYHTFQGGCKGDGDHVSDTPACQKSWSCDEKQDTCPTLPGKDAVHNFMAYGKCRDRFTAGQGKRARSQYQYYRA